MKSIILLILTIQTTNSLHGSSSIINTRTLQTSEDDDSLSAYVADHPYYPSHSTLSCLDSRINPAPSWMTYRGYAENHLSASLEECCSNWGFECNDPDASDDNNAHDDDDEDIITMSATAASLDSTLHSKDNDRPIIASPVQTITVASATNEAAAAAALNDTPMIQVETIDSTQQTNTDDIPTFPTMSCGSDYLHASQCHQLCLSGTGCPDGQSCHTSVPCPSDLVAAAMGNTDASILQLIGFNTDDNNDLVLRNVCGSSYEDAEMSCRDGYTEDFVTCDKGAHQCPAGREICYNSLICPNPPTMEPTKVPTKEPTMSPSVSSMVANTHSISQDSLSDDNAIMAMMTDEEEPIVRKDKTAIVGIPIIQEPNPSPPVTAPNNNNNPSPYTIDKSSLGSVAVASTSCTGGCPSGSTCVGNAANGQLIQDSECQPCSEGQTWWPCDVQGLCWCWIDGTDRIAPAPPSDMENVMGDDPHYTVCDDILTREVFETIAPESQEPYSYEGLCDAILSYNAHHTEKAFGMGDAYMRAAELAAFLGNTLHESDEFRAGREYLMCADRKTVNGEVYCKPCDSGSFDWASFTCPISLISGTAEFNEYCQPSSKPPEACQCGNGKGQTGELEGYVPARDLFFGRGAIQLSWNYNYIGASVALTGSPDTFCDNPDLVATEGKYAWGAGLFFWMEHSKEGTTCHTESLNNMDFGGTLNNINGGLECPAHGGWHEEAIKMRLNRYCRASKALGLPNLMTLSRCAGLEEKMTACLSDGTCGDCQDYVGTNAGDHPKEYSPPVSSPANSVPAEQPIQPDAQVSLCGEGLMALPGRPECCVPNTAFIGDGACDPEAPYNTKACMWDGGDCCKSTCKTDSPFGCKTKEDGDLGDYGPFGFYCLDPSQGADVMFAGCRGSDKERIGDGKCNPKYNIAACNFDGGDCCEQTCDSEFGFYPCGSAIQSFVCMDPRFMQAQTSAPSSRPTANPVIALTPNPSQHPTEGTRSPTSSSPISPNPTEAQVSLTPIESPITSAPTVRPSMDPTKKATTTIEELEMPCPSDFKECENGVFVSRNPLNNCRFALCPDDEEASQEVIEQPEMLCPSDFKECKNGVFVTRNPLKNCRFTPCPEVTTVEELAVVEPQKVVQQCQSDFKECEGGVFVSRDPFDNCRFKPCSDMKQQEDDPDRHHFSSTIEAALQGEKIGQSQPKDKKTTVPTAAPVQDDESFVICPQDVRECPDGAFVGRDPKNSCKYFPCTGSIATQHSKTSIANAVSSSMGGSHQKGSDIRDEVEAMSSSTAGVVSDTDAPISLAGAVAASIADTDHYADLETADATEISSSIANTMTSSMTVNAEATNRSEPSDSARNSNKVKVATVSHGKSNVHKKGNK